MQAVAAAAEKVGALLTTIAVVVVALLAFPIFYDACARKAGAPTTWVFEVSQYALITGAFLANAGALKQGNHFRVGILLTLFPGWRRGLDDLSLVATLIFGFVIAIGSGLMVRDSFENGIRSGTIFDIAVWIPQSVVTLGGIALVLQAAAMLILRESPAETSELL